MALLDELLRALWTDQAAIAPQAARVHQLLRDRGEAVRIDHIAMRTFDVPGVDIDALDRAFVAEGYDAAQTYEVPGRRLIAYHYEHRDHPGRPKLLFSALLVDELSREAQAIVRGLVAQLAPGAAAHASFAVSGRSWQLSSSELEALRAESEEAAWVAAFGFRASHFSVDASGLRGFDGLAELNRFLVECGYRVDQAGGEIKGSRAELLEQSATVAEVVDVELADRKVRMPACPCEFARRYAQPDGTLFQGFLPLALRSCP
jgi:hypothetical protein